MCSGDAGVYGMASPLLELAEGCPDVTVEVVPGLTAALSGGAVLGAPLAHDFCVLSLSDRLTPWEVIEKRLAAAAMGDFCMAVYNPSSKGRPDYLARAVRILLQNGKAPDTVCGLVRNIGREGQSAQVLTLAQLEQTPVDMFTTVYVALPSTFGHTTLNTVLPIANIATTTTAALYLPMYLNNFPIVPLKSLAFSPPIIGPWPLLGPLKLL